MFHFKSVKHGAIGQLSNSESVSNKRWPVRQLKAKHMVSVDVGVWTGATAEILNDQTKVNGPKFNSGLFVCFVCKVVQKSSGEHV